MANLVGQQIEHYRIDTLLGEGGMGAVYLAFDLNLARRVALKVMHANFAAQAEFQRRFMQEAQAAARLDHPAIIKIFNFAARQNLFYMVMEYVPGASLNNYLKRLAKSNQVLKLNETLIILAQVADALGYAHRQGVVHRDIKPDNVLLKTLEQPDREGESPLRAIVTDFGLAKLREGGIQTQTGTFMGTLPYMSPEQCQGAELDGRSDLYSLGIMVYQLATGKLPFTIKSPTDAVMKHLHETPPPPRAVRPGLPPAIESVIARAIQKKPEDRFQSGEEMAKALRQAAGGLTDEDVTRLGPAGAAVSLATQLLPEQLAGEPSRMGFDLTALPGQDRLLIARTGENPKSVTLNKATVTLGRAPENNVPLPAEGISRRHARLEQTADGWRVVDMGSTNGTFLDGNRLLPDIPEPWEPSQALRIGPYHIRWQRVAAPTVGPAYSFQPKTQVPLGGTMISSGSGRLSLVVNPTNVDVAPGGRVDLQVDLLNQGSTVDHFQLRLEGIPAGWATLPREPLQLMPGARGTLPVTVHPPLDSSATAGEHPYRLMAQSTSEQEENVAVSGKVVVKPFTRFTLDAKPTTLRHGGVSRIAIANQGNAPMTFEVSGHDPAEAIRFEAAQNRLELPPEGQETVEMTIAARQRPLLGATKQMPFEIGARAATGELQSRPGQLEVRPVLPPWLIPLLAALLLILCASGIALSAYFGNRNEQATATAEARLAGVLAATATAEALQAVSFQGTEAAAQATGVAATALALTAEAEGDNDSDGLSNNDEATAGTDANNPDTDGDGLSDGEEVNQHGTDPRNRDSDGDTLPDGEEVNTHHTSPTNPDTDGDGLTDGVEVAGGLNPILPDPPTAAATDTPTATGTSLPPSHTPTFTPPPDTPTFTPTPTPSATPPPNYGLRFDGVDDYVVIPDSGDFDFGNTFTVEAWVNPTSLTTSGNFSAIVQGANSEPPFSGGSWVLFLDDDDYTSFGLSVCLPSCNSAVSGPGFLETNEWQHLAATYDGFNIRTYLNGEMIADQAHGFAGDVSDVNVVLIGTWITSFRGMIDEVRLWNVARQPEEILENYELRLAGDEAGLVGYYKFDEGSGQAVMDSSAGGNHGELGAAAGADTNDPAWELSDVPLRLFNLDLIFPLPIITLAPATDG